MVERAAELAARPGHYATDQFNNPYIVHDHRDHLGREIWEQTGGRMTAFCQGMGTASSLMGVSEALHPHGVFIQGHEPAGSAAISGGAPGWFVMQGWAGFVMPLWNPDAVDHIEAIPDDEALEMTRRLAREEGIFAGISTGANVVGAHRLAERLGSDAVIVSLAVDTGFKYLSVSPYAELASQRAAAHAKNLYAGSGLAETNDVRRRRCALCLASSISASTSVSSSSRSTGSCDRPDGGSTVVEGLRTLVGRQSSLTLVTSVARTGTGASAIARHPLKRSHRWTICRRGRIVNRREPTAGRASPRPRPVPRVGATVTAFS